MKMFAVALLLVAGLALTGAKQRRVDGGSVQTAWAHIHQHDRKALCTVGQGPTGPR